MQRSVLKALLGATLFVVPLSLLGCPSPKAVNTAPPAVAGATVVTKDTQTQSIQSSVTALQATIQDLSGSMQGMLKEAAGVRGVQSVGATPQSVYRALVFQAGTYSAGNGTSFGVDSNGQLSSLNATDSALTFAFTGNGASERTATVNVTKTPDGTVGSAMLDVTTANWVGVPQATNSFQIWYNQMPDLNQLQALSASLDLTPQGVATKRVNINAGVSSFAQFPVSATGSARIPTHYFVKGFIPRLTVDQTLDLKTAGGTQVSATLAGTLSLDTTTQGIQSWRESVTLNGDTTNPTSGNLQFSLENLTQQYKLTGSLQPKTGGGVILAGQIVSTADSSQLGTLAFDSTTDTNPYILLANGQRIDLKPHQ